MNVFARKDAEENRDFWSEVHEWRIFLKEQNFSYIELKQKYHKALKKKKKNIEWLTALAEEIKTLERLNIEKLQEVAV